MNRALRSGSGQTRARRISQTKVAVVADAILSLLILLTPATPASADNVDEPDLMQTLIAEDATLNNNLNLIEPRWQKSSQGRTLELGFGIEKMLSPRLEVEVGGAWDSISPHDGRSGSGFGDVDLKLKYVFLEQPNFQVAVAPQLSFPTQSAIAGEPTQSQAGGLLSWGGRFGTRNEIGWTRYLRALEFQGDVGYSHGFGGRGSDEIFFDPVLDYSLPYLGYATGVQTPWPLRNLCVFTEFNFDQLLDGSGDGSLSLFATPGLAYLADTYQITVGVQVPLTHGAEQNTQTAVVGAFLIFLDKLNPTFGRMLF
jgi:hypothetical protein